MHQTILSKYLKNNKRILLSVLLLVATTSLFCGCNSKGEAPMNDIQYEINAAPIGPVKDFDINDHISTANSLLDAVTDSYGKMNALVSENTSEEAKKAVENVEKLYAERIEELKQADFSTWSAEDLSDLSTELSYIITAIREARDLLGS